jgi:cellulose synthase operon protein C
VVGSLSLMLREDPTLSNVRLDSAEAVRNAASARQDVRELMFYAISDDFFRLRQKLRLGLS